MLPKSTHHSIENGEISKLAIGETIFSIYVVLVISINYNVFLPFGIACLIAPLLLLRTEKSTELGLKITKFVFRINDNQKDLNKEERLYYRVKFPNYFFISLPLTMFIAPIIFFFIRFTALTYTVITSPLKSIRAIPTNWTRIVLCVDLNHPPEFIPKINEVKELEFLHYNRFLDYASDTSFNETLSYLKKQTVFDLIVVFFSGVSAGAFFLVFIIFMYTPPLLYRFSLKATSIIYGPLIWVVNHAFLSKLTVEQRLHLIRKSDIGFLSFIYSICIVFILMMKIYFLLYQDIIMEIENHLFLLLLEPSSLPLWQLAILINGIITIALFLYSGWHINLKSFEIQDNSWLHGTIIQVGIMVRLLLSIYWIIPSTFYIVLTSVLLKIPSIIGTRLFPWQ